MNQQKNKFNTITNQVNSLNTEQLSTLFNVYYHLQYHSNFFMSQNSYYTFMTLFNTTVSKYQSQTFKTLINLLTTTYTNPDRYPDTLKTIELIKNNYSLFEIINIIYLNR